MYKVWVTEAVYNITVVYRTQQGAPTPGFRAYHKSGSEAWFNDGNKNASTSYLTASTFTATYGQTVNLGVQSGPSDITFGVGNGGTYTGYCGTGSVTSYSFTVTEGSTQYLNIATSGNAYVTCTAS